ncbi:hypothetical protein E3N88_28974 [Mikania micrantha]|uniref:Uncharacterized protein n=1 Tax=Mikania micrantha TaxID=192012 RepID=A0A5N6N106_9ASTR|nr:hypothetical protein E3N88_28974 [Mikania micrantha]
MKQPDDHTRFDGKEELKQVINNEMNNWELRWKSILVLQVVWSSYRDVVMNRFSHQDYRDIASGLIEGLATFGVAYF